MSNSHSVFSETDARHMARALELAARGLYSATPNPRVGCVIVANDAIVGEGWHRRAGEAHAEVHALSAADTRARGATAYVTLEPCAHHGRTPPCSEALVSAGVTRVVAAMQDPNPIVAGKGFAQMREAGLTVECGLMEHEARELNVGFVSRMTRGRPWTRIKIAATLDGRTALANGRSQWITSPAARRDGHHFRARACAIVAGIGTITADDPQLTVREVDTSRQPLRVIVDSRLETPPDARAIGRGTLVATVLDDAVRRRELERRGAEVIVLHDDRGRVDLDALLAELARREMNELHVEAGPTLSGAFVRERLADELVAYLAPRLIGNSGLGMFDLPEIASLDQARELAIREITRIGEDLRVIARFTD